MIVVEFVKKDENTFGGDNYRYRDKENGDNYVVCVGWALLEPYCTTVTRNGGLVSMYNDERYVYPDEALERLFIRIEK